MSAITARADHMLHNAQPTVRPLSRNIREAWMQSERVDNCSSPNMDFTSANTRADMADIGRKVNTIWAARAHAGMVEACVLKKLRIPEVKESMSFLPQDADSKPCIHALRACVQKNTGAGLPAGAERGSGKPRREVGM